MMSREALFERMYNEVCDPWTLTDDEKEQERKHFYECLDLGDVHEYIESIEETRDSICRPEGVHGCYDFEEMRKFNDLINELKDASAKTYTKIVEYYSEGGDLTFIMKETWYGQEPVESEVVGFYYGEPNKEETEYFKDKGVKATYER